MPKDLSPQILKMELSLTAKQPFPSFPHTLSPGQRRWVDVLPSYQSPGDKGWSSGSADCVRRHLQAGSLKGRSADPEPKAYLILSGEALYRMDYGELLRTHNETGAEITIATSRRRLGDVDATNLGICSISEEDTAVYGFREKPTLDELKKMAVCDGDDQKLEDCEVTVNMGVYIFSRWGCTKTWG
jgi:glucose-1-phosphate adenylyltransferase